MWSVFLSFLLLGNINPTVDSFVFKRLAERKCDEFLDLTYPEYKGSNETEKVIDCKRRLGIVGGYLALPGNYPHMALLGYDSGAGGGELEWNCGGSIISLRFILTAAHCIHTSRGPPVQVRVGNLNKDPERDESQVIPVLKTIAHEQYKSPVVYNDIGLIELAYDVQVTRFSFPACLHMETWDLLSRTLSATGWGDTAFQGDPSPDLLVVNLDQFAHAECNQSHEVSKWLPRGLASDSQLCAGSRTESKDTCQGDSGGPLQIGNDKSECLSSVVGITSFGKGCGIVGVPSVYTRVAHFIDWIEQRAFV